MICINQCTSLVELIFSLDFYTFANFSFWLLPSVFIHFFFFVCIISIGPIIVPNCDFDSNSAKNSNTTPSCGNKFCGHRSGGADCDAARNGESRGAGRHPTVPGGHTGSGLQYG